MYLVRTTFTSPAGMPASELARLRDSEAAAAAALQRDGRLLQLWRDAENVP